MSDSLSQRPSDQFRGLMNLARLKGRKSQIQKQTTRLFRKEVIGREKAENEN